VFQEEARVPLILAEDALAPLAVDVPAHHVDVLPTILARCGVRFDRRQFEGIDLLSQGAPPERTLFVTRFAYPLDDLLEPTSEREWYAVVRGDWKLIVRDSQDPRAPPRQTLYDLASDPEEAQDRGPSHPRQVAERALALRDFLARQGRRRAEFLGRYPGPVTMGQAGPNPAMPASLLESLKSLGYIR
jgi:arylsulfatase A-like enzyme